MPRSKFKTQAQRDYPLLSNIANSQRDPRDEDDISIEDVNRPEDVPFRDAQHWWFTWQFKLKRGGQQQKLEGWERKCIEAYVMGWLTCYDKEIKGKPQFDHDIFFDWEDDDNNRKTVLEVYIDPQDM